MTDKQIAAYWRRNRDKRFTALNRLAKKCGRPAGELWEYMKANKLIDTAAIERLPDAERRNGE